MKKQQLQCSIAFQFSQFRQAAFSPISYATIITKGLLHEFLKAKDLNDFLIFFFLFFFSSLVGEEEGMREKSFGAISLATKSTRCQSG